MTSVRHNDALVAGVRAYLDARLDLNTFLADFEPQWQRMAAQMCAKFGVDAELRDDVVSIVREQAWLVLDDPPATLSEHNYGGLVVYRSNLAVAKLLRSHSSPLSGTNKIAERRSGLARTRTAMIAALGYEPSDADVIERYNADTLARNPRAARQGALARTSDLSPNALGSVTSVDSVAAGTGMSVGEAYDRLAPMSDARDEASGIDLGSVVTTALSRLSEDDAAIVRVYLAETLENDAAPSTTRLKRVSGASRDDIDRAVLAFKGHLIDAMDEAASA